MNKDARASFEAGRASRVGCPAALAGVGHLGEPPGRGEAGQHLGGARTAGLDAGLSPMRFEVTLHIDVPDGTDIDAFEMRGWFEEQFEGVTIEDEEFTINIISCEEVKDAD
jgi:hypothetical protein